MTGSLHRLMMMSAPAAGLLVSSLWEGLVLIAFVGLLVRCLPRLSAAARSAVWTAILMIVLLLPILVFHGSAGRAESAGVVHAGLAWSLGISAVWLGSSLLRLWQLISSALRLRGVARRAVAADTSGSIAALLSRSGRSVTLCVSEDVTRPSLIGFFRPRILLPAGLLEQLSAPELEHVVLHELEHLRRHDDWINLLQKLSLAVYPLHPALLWLDRRLCLERELACDDGVLRATNARKAYAACLARLAEDSMVRRGWSLALGLLGGRQPQSELAVRVYRILGSPAAAMSRVQCGAATAVLLTGVLGGSMLLTRSPRLISFQPAAQPLAEAEISAAPAGWPVLAREQAAKPLLLKTIMRQPAIRPVPMAATITRKRFPVRRVAFVRKQEPAAPSPYVVLAEWRATTDQQPHMTLTVARYSQASQVSQYSYAAVPVQGGWLLIQL